MKPWSIPAISASRRCERPVSRRNLRTSLPMARRRSRLIRPVEVRWVFRGVVTRRSGIDRGWLDVLTQGSTASKQRRAVAAAARSVRCSALRTSRWLAANGSDSIWRSQPFRRRALARGQRFRTRSAGRDRSAVETLARGQRFGLDRSVARPSDSVRWPVANERAVAHGAAWHHAQFVGSGPAIRQQQTSLGRDDGDSLAPGQRRACAGNRACLRRGPTESVRGQSGVLAARANGERARAIDVLAARANGVLAARTPAAGAGRQPTEANIWSKWSRRGTLGARGCAPCRRRPARALLARRP